MPFELSTEQKQASQLLYEATSQSPECYLYAVCGAGKTEILYQSIFNALINNQRIALVIPRTNIVKELALRLKPIFPNTTLKCVYEDEKDDSDADILVLTPQQLIRYDHEFDLMFIDEADAFPFKGNAFLNQLVQKAIKVDGKLVQMSATMPKSQQKIIHQTKKPIFILPARFHRHSLDNFQIGYVLNLGNWIRQSALLPPLIVDWLNVHQSQNRQTLLFVPTIEWGNRVFYAMKEQGYSVESVSSVEGRRDEKIDWFREKRGLFLVSTTLLERGVTFSDIDVGILHGSHSVYDEFTLVQMAGRVGRKQAFPTGEIKIFTEKRTRSIKRAMAYINNMNAEAKRRGLLDDMPNMS